MELIVKKTIVKSIFGIIFLSLIFGLFYIGYIVNMKSDISNNVLRLHIVAASDSEQDQKLKLLVRDRILNDFSDIFSSCDSLSDSKIFASQNIEKIKTAAKDELLKNDCLYDIDASIEPCDFPTKAYDDITLPQGRYTALNIKIGDAHGHNWWCIMFPPLCITKNCVSISDTSRAKLKSVLTPDEYNLICSDKTNLNVKFKIAEILGKYFK